MKTRILALLAAAFALLAAPLAHAQVSFGAVNTGTPTYTNGESRPFQLDASGNLKVAVVPGSGSSTVSQGSSTTGQNGVLTQCAVTTAPPAYASGTTNPINCTPRGAQRVETDGVPDAAIRTDSVSSAAASPAFSMSGYGAISFQVIANTTNTMVIEGSNDGGTTWSTIAFKSAGSTAANTAVLSSQPPATATFIPAFTMAQMRWRVSVFASGTTTIATTFRRSVNPNVVDAYVGNTFANINTSGNNLLAASAAPCDLAACGLASSRLTAVGSALVAKAGPGNLYDWQITSGASAGYALIFNATSAPADGAVTPSQCIALQANATVGSGFDVVPEYYSTGITIVFSTTGCFTKTASATAFIRGRAQ